MIGSLEVQAGLKLAVTEDDRKLPVFLPLLPKCWDHRHVPPHPFEQCRDGTIPLVLLHTDFLGLLIVGHRKWLCGRFAVLSVSALSLQ